MGFIGAAKFSFTMSFVSYAIGLLHFFVGCDNHLVAGMTASYEGWVLNRKDCGFLHSSQKYCDIKAEKETCFCNAGEKVNTTTCHWSSFCWSAECQPDKAQRWLKIN